MDLHKVKFPGQTRVEKFSRISDKNSSKNSERILARILKRKNAKEFWPEFRLKNWPKNVEKLERIFNAKIGRKNATKIQPKNSRD